MKALLGLLLAIGILGCALVFGPGCATGPSPCIGSAKDRETMPCTCATTLNPACLPWITDAKKPDGGQDR